MPPEPTVRFSSRSFGHVELPTQDLEILAEVTGTSVEGARERLGSYELGEMADAWRRADPRTPADMRSFYAETDLYLWELTGWNHSGSYARYRHLVDRLVERWPPRGHPRALDYGSGIGTTALRLAAAGYRPVLADVPGRTLAFARERLRRRGIEHDVVEVRHDVPSLPAGGFHVVTCFDVIEHLPDPLAVAGRLAAALRPGGGAAIVANFAVTGDEWPHHLDEPARRFRGPRWVLHLQALGLRPLGQDLFERLGPGATAVRRAQHALWRATGLRVELAGGPHVRRIAP